MKPILFLQSRPEDDVCDNELQAVCSLGGIDSDRIVRFQMDRDELVELDLDAYAAIIMGGGPANFADDKILRYEPWLIDLVKRIVAADKPFLGMCLGIGTIAVALGMRPSFDYGEPVVAMEISQTDEGMRDPLLAGVPREFHGLVGHKEGIGAVPEGAVELARSETCVQMLRCGQHVYATQFHPELDIEGLAIRVEAYKMHGYFAPEEASALVEDARQADISHAVKVLQNFAKSYIT